MSEQVIGIGTPRQEQNNSHMVLAWAILSVAFVAFCAICIVVTASVQYFLFESSIPVSAELTIGRGTAGVTGTDLIEQVVRYDRSLAPGSTVTTDSLSQATLAFYDPGNPGQLIASITIDNDTTLNLGALTRPRFDWSALGYDIQLNAFTGAIDVFVPDSVGRPVSVRTETPGAGWLYATAPGSYTFTADQSGISVTNEFGSAVIVSADRERTQPVGVDQQASYRISEREFTLTSSHLNLLGDEPLPRSVALGSQLDSSIDTPVWTCYNGPYDDPVGSFATTTVDGREVVRFLRGGGAQNHGESGCALGFGGTGVDVTGYSELLLTTTFRIDAHSLSVCGVEGSECPLMLRIDYVPATGQPAVSWYHGFFAFIDGQYAYPVICSSCTREHESVNMGHWYTYQSDNLFSMFPPNLRPAQILNVRLYASGHEYDVMVADIQLLAGSQPTQIPAAS